MSENPVFGSNTAFLKPTVEMKLSVFTPLFITKVFRVYKYGFSNDHKVGLFTVMLVVNVPVVPAVSEEDELFPMATTAPVLSDTVELNTIA